MLNRVKKIAVIAEIKVCEAIIKCRYGMFDYGIKRKIGSVNDYYEWCKDLEKCEDEMCKLYDKLDIVA